MKNLLLCCLLVICTIPAAAQIVLSEIMFNPSGNERYDEFVEIYNTGSEVVDLSGWLISDSSKFNYILPYKENALLPPQSYGLILVPNYFEMSGIYDAEIPDDVVLLTIGNAQFGAYGLKNSEGEHVSLHTPDSVLVAAYTYTPDNKDGISEEKIDLAAGDDSDNWLNSIKAGGTPGYKNSVALSEYDLSLVDLAVCPERPGCNDSLVLEITVKNIGKIATGYFEVEIAEIFSTDNRILLSERIGSSLSPGDSLDIQMILPPFVFGEHVLIATISHELDDNHLNDSHTAGFEVVASYSPGAVVINEIMYNTDEKSDEWIELYNATPDTVLLRDWIIRDQRKSTLLSDTLTFLPPNRFCLLVNQKHSSAAATMQLEISLPELNNSGDELILCDATGQVIDSVAYTSDIGGRNVSIERIRGEHSGTPQNWDSCIDSLGSTPGSINSISPKSFDASIDGASLQCVPSRPMEGETVEISAQVVNCGRRSISGVNVSFSFAALPSDTFTKISGAATSTLDVEERRTVGAAWADAPAGAFKIRVEVDMQGDMASTNNSVFDTIFVSAAEPTLVINEVMYSPETGAGEWIELLNCGERPVQLFGCSMASADSSEKLRMASTPFNVEPQDFVVLARDSSLLDECRESLIVLPQMPSLKNDADSIYIFDANHRVIECVFYTADMGGARGRSLERINAGVDSFERSNWTTCVSTAGHTCCAANSVNIGELPAGSSLSVSPNPFSPDGDGEDDFAGISYALPANTAQVNIKIYDIQGRLVRFLLNNELSGSQRTVFWDGLNEEGRRCRIGIYIIYFEALNQSALCVERLKKTVVLAGRL